MKRFYVVVSVLLLLSLALSACGTKQAPTAVPSQPATTAPEPTKAPEATKAPEPTQPPAAGGVSGAITLWHGWTGAEADKLNELIAKFQEANPQATVDILAVPFDQLKNKFTTEASTGGGPDLMIGPKDWIGELAQAGLIQPLDDLAGQIGLDALNKSAVDANRFQGKVWAFPESTEAVALWYNKTLVANPPTDSDELSKLAAEVGLGDNIGFYHSAGLLLGAGGKLFDENAACVMDQGAGVADAIDYIASLKKIDKVISDADGGKLDAAFKDGLIGMIFNGPWATGDYSKALGAENLGIVAPITLKYGDGGKFAPFLGTKNVFLSANTSGDAPLAFLKFMSEADTQKMLTEVGHIPSNPNVQVDDPLLAGFLAQTAVASYFPNEPEMGAVWTPAGDMIIKVLEGKSTAAEAVAEACATINAANKKEVAAAVVSEPPPAAGKITLWHGWTGSEADKLNEVIAKFQEKFPDATVDILAVPFDQLKNKFTTEASTGGGPDLMIGPKDWIGELAQAGLIQPLDDLAAKINLDALNKSAVDANRFQGKVWAFPESTEAVALWYNKTLVTTPPTDSDELSKLAAEVGLGDNIGFYHSAGLLLGGGGKLFDENAKCVMDQGAGVTDAIDYIASLKKIDKVISDADGGKLDAAFKDGLIGMIFNGPWATGDYSKALGAENLGIVAPITLKYGDGGQFSPFLGTKNIFLSANAASEAPLAFLWFMAQADTQKMLTEVGHIPSNPKVQVDDPLLAGFLTQTGVASYFPNEPEMGAVWTPAGDMIIKVLEGKSTAAEAVAEACATINAANNK